MVVLSLMTVLQCHCNSFVAALTRGTKLAGPQAQAIK
jgi:hypothetical protein